MIFLTDHKNKKNKNGVIVSHNKMDGMTSINTSVEKNEFCQGMINCGNKDIICASCYTRRIKYPSVEKPYANNFDYFNSTDFLPERINRSVIRFHAIGELSSEIHFQNFVKLASVNPQTRFVLWTKRIDIINAVFAGVKKPKNLKIIRSSIHVNKPDKKVKFIDKVFTVYTTDFIAKNGIEINCQKECKSCMICYSAEFDKVKNVSEIIKVN